VHVVVPAAAVALTAPPPAIGLEGADNAAVGSDGVLVGTGPPAITHGADQLAAGIIAVGILGGVDINGAAPAVAQGIGIAGAAHRLDGEHYVLMTLFSGNFYLLQFSCPRFHDVI